MTCLFKHIIQRLRPLLLGIQSSLKLWLLTTSINSTKWTYILHYLIKVFQIAVVKLPIIEEIFKLSNPCIDENFIVDYYGWLLSSNILPFLLFQMLLWCLMNKRNLPTSMQTTHQLLPHFLYFQIVDSLLMYAAASNLLIYGHLPYKEQVTVLT